MITKSQILNLIRSEPYKIGIWVGFKDLTRLHNKWLKAFLFGTDDLTLLAHRGSYKTTVLSLMLALNIVIYPNKSVLFFRKTDTDVFEVIEQVVNILSSGCMKYIIRLIYGVELKFNKKTANEIDTNLRTSIKGASQLIGLGIGTSITGKHADIVVTDDIVNLTDRISRAERDKTRLRYMELQNIKNRSGRFINTGTPWHKDDAISIMPNKIFYDCYSTGLISKEEIKAIRSKMTDSLFCANYELKHIAAEDVLFNNPQFISETELIFNGSAHIDASYGGEDSTAFTIFKPLDDGRVIGFGKLWHKHVDDCMTDIDMYMEQFRAGSIICEKNADKGYLKSELTERGHKASVYHESMNKYVKISTYLKKYWNKILWLDDTDAEYINEILDYSEHSPHDDAPDSAASLLRSFEKRTTIRTFKGGI